MQPHIIARLTMLNKTEDFGRTNPIASGYRGQFYYNGIDCIASYILPSEKVHLAPGETTFVEISFAVPQNRAIDLHIGTVFLVKEGKSVVGFGEVVEFLSAFYEVKI